jgi:hypothetical protein
MPYNKITFAYVRVKELNMNKILLKLMKPFIRGFVLKELADDKNKEIVLSYLTDKISIPKLTKAEEKKMFDQIYEALEVNIKSIIERI